MIKVDKVCKSFGAKKVLSDVSFQVEKGEVLALLGKSGGGKSTLLKIIAGLLQSTEGEVFIRDEKILGPEDVLVPGHPDIRLAYQDFNLQDGLSVEGHLKYALRRWNHEGREEQIQRLLKICAIEEYRLMKPPALSGGTRQRVAIALSLAEETEVLLLDEPFSQLDTLTRTRLKELLFEAVKEMGVTVIFVTHEGLEALAFADRIAVLSDGQINKIGTPIELYENPQDKLTASLLGEVNYLTEAELQTLGYEKPFDAEEFGVRPEAIILIPLASKGDGNGKKDLTGIVKKIYFYGAYQMVEFDVKGIPLKAIKNNTSGLSAFLKVGMEVSVQLNTAQFFGVFV